jgi:hypothetical protein
VFVPGNSFQSSLILLGKALAHPFLKTARDHTIATSDHAMALEDNNLAFWPYDTMTF